MKIVTIAKVFTESFNQKNMTMAAVTTAFNLLRDKLRLGKQGGDEKKESKTGQQ